MLGPLGVSVERARSETLRRFLGSTASPAQPIPFSDKALAVRFRALYEHMMLDAGQENKWRLAASEAVRSGTPLDYARVQPEGEVDTDHLLLGLITEDARSARILEALGASYKSVRELIGSRHRQEG